MAIQWFPGHMHKARKELAGSLPDADALLMIRDARIPFSSHNPMLENLARELPVLNVLTRRDLADERATAVWLDELSKTDDTDAIAIVASDRDGTREIPARLQALVPAASRSRVRPWLVLVTGIPNVGKSTLINTLTGRSIAATGNEPAITRRQQDVSLNERWRLRDTPGMLWPSVDNEASGYRLAATGAIRDTAMDSAEVATWLLDYLTATYAERLRARYGDTLPIDDSVAALEFIGRERGCLGSGGLVDFDRAGRLLLQEFRSGTLGGMTLETPAMRDRELAATERRLAEREAKRARRRDARRAARKSAKARGQGR
ncbi:MAG: ribosome biogenesis GTPase YlqF [Gammaproteobacteria bacterium]|nr:MAG: ribosome biogenesis GTPase YlqF [Gammaproteobacteria bacterium]